MTLDDIKDNPFTPLQQIKDSLTEKSGIELFVKRLDMIHPEISGNKWYKLKYNLVEAKEKSFDTLLTFGGAYSNHIYATAAAADIFNFKSIGVIRGEEHLPLNPTLQFVSQRGMILHYLNRTNYRIKNSKDIINYLKDKFGNFYIIPEGGSNILAIKGCKEIVKDIGQKFDFICTASGTGGTLAGLVSGNFSSANILGFSVLKNGEFLNQNVVELLSESGESNNSNWKIFTSYHFGGYAKINYELIEFIKEFYKKFSVQLEPVYSGKMMFGIYDLIKKNYFPPGSKIIALHNGGLQGLEGMRRKIRLLENLKKHRNL